MIQFVESRLNQRGEYSMQILAEYPGQGQLAPGPVIRSQ
jgi:hypothetical protein